MNNMQRTERKTGDGFFSRLFTLYLCIILLPIMSVYCILIYRSNASIKEDTMRTVGSDLTYVRQYIDSKISELAATATLARYNRILHASYRDMDSYSRVEIVEELEKYRRSYSIVTDVYLVYKDDDKVYSSSGTMTSQLFMQTVMWQLLPQKDALFSGKEIFSARDDSDYLIYACPVLKAGTSQSSIVFQIDKKALFDVTKILGRDEAFAFHAFLPNGKALFSYGDVLEPSLVYRSTLSSEDGRINSAQIGDGAYSGVTGKSSYGWTFTLLSKDKSFFNVLITERATSLLFFAILVIGILVAFRIALAQSKPLSRIAALSNAPAPIKPTLKGVADNLIESHEMLLSRLDQQKKLSSAQFITLLLCESSEMTHERISSIASEFSIPEMGRFVALYLQPDVRGETKQVREKLNNASCGAANAIATPIGTDGAIGIVLYEPEGQADKGNIETLLETVRGIIKENLQGDCSIGQGGLCFNLLKIGHSFSQAQIAAEYSVTRPDGGIITYDSVKDSHAEYAWTHLGDIVRFCDSLRNRQQSTARDLLITLIEDIKSQNHEPAISKSMCGELVMHFIRTVSDMRIDCDEYLPLFKFSSINGLEKNMLKAIDDVCRTEQNTSSSAASILYDAIYQYILQNIGSYDLSLETVANAMGYSKTYVSSAIHEVTGGTFKEMVTQLRLKQVCDQLKETDLPINEIVTRAGYVDPSSFTRKFKKLVGLTPGEYRKAYTQTSGM